MGARSCGSHEISVFIPLRKNLVRPDLPGEIGGTLQSIGTMGKNARKMLTAYKVWFT